MGRTDDLLDAILDELKALRSDVSKIQSVLPLVRPLFDGDDVHNELVSIKDAVAALAERVTGPLGYTIGDLHSQANDIAHSLAMIEVNTSP